jgi:hypothetical protein
MKTAKTSSFIDSMNSKPNGQSSQRRAMKWLSIALVLTVFASGCSTTGSGSKPTSGNFKIVKIHFLGSLWNEAHAKVSIISQDGGESFAVPGGGIWAFGDTFKGSSSTDGTPHYAGGAVSCSIAFLGENARYYPPTFKYLASTGGVVMSPFEYFPDEPKENHRIWPLGGVYVDGQYYLYYSLIEIFGSGSWDFRGVGSGLGCSKVASGPYQRLQPHGNWRFPVEPTQVMEAGGWLYLYSIEDFKGGSGVGLARVRPEKIKEPDAYEFYTGPGPKFSSQKRAAVYLVKDISGQISVAWNPYLQKYVMASSSDFYHPREILLLVADTPYGPWSSPVARIIVPEYRQRKRVNLVYCTYLHPELFRENGRVMNVTYSLNLEDAGFDANCEMAEIEVERLN